jgi:tripartite-type tricarboxylate transporter receptor subunit TctC
VIVPLLRKTACDPLKDLVPVTQFTDGTLLVAVHPSVPANTLQELMAHAKAKRGQVELGHSRRRLVRPFVLSVVQAARGVDILHVPYRGGGESLADFLVGVFHIMRIPIRCRTPQAARQSCWRSSTVATARISPICRS